MKKNLQFYLSALTLFLSSILFAQTTTFNSNGTYTVPAGVTSITVEAWGAGGGGGGGNTANAASGGGGGAHTRYNFTVIPGNTYTINVGAGGVTSTAGGNSTVLLGATTVIRAAGGGGGSAAGIAGAARAGGAGGAASAGIPSTGVGLIITSGGNGGSNTTNSRGGAGGGGSAGTGGNGGNGQAGGLNPAAQPFRGALGGAAGSGTGGNAGSVGGAGGTRSGANAEAGFPGFVPGSGGGGRSGTAGAASNTAGGTGANGRVIISIDSDGDGITDNLDLDNDNDGILDTDEGVYPLELRTGTTAVGTNDPNWTVDWILPTAADFAVFAAQPANDRTVTNYSPPNGIYPRPAYVTGKLISVWLDAPAGSNWISTVFAGTSNGPGNHTDADRDGIINEGIPSGGSPVTGTGDYVYLKFRRSVTIPAGVTASTVSLTLTTVTDNYSAFYVNGVFNGPIGDQFSSNTTITLDKGWVNGVNIIEVRVISGPILIGFAVTGNSVVAVDTDGDLIPDYLDVDSDNDGCADAVEGPENVGSDQIWPLNLPITDPNFANRGRIKVIYNGVTTNMQPNIISNSIASFGVPQLVNNAGNNLNSVTNPFNLAGLADNTDTPPTADIGQGIGSSKNALVNGCICYVNPQSGTGIPTNHGITLLKRAGADNGNWPMIRNGAFTALESNTKGFVITRVAGTAGITAPQEGMMVFDTTPGVQCLKIYDGTQWSCFNTPACP